MSYGDFRWHLREAFVSLHIARWWPWMTKKRHNKAMRSTQDYWRREVNAAKEEHERDFANLARRVYDLRLDMVRRGPECRFMLTAAFNERLMQHGDLKEIGPYLAARMEAEISRALAQVDFTKLKPWPNQPNRHEVGYTIDLGIAK